MLSPQVIEGCTKPVGLLGWPVAHSLSPIIHNHIFAKLGLPYAYIPVPVKPENLPAAVAAIRVCGFAGANVTVPHKIDAAKFCDRLSAESAMTGAVNTLYFENSELCGTTTDADGFLEALRHISHNPEDGRIVILGNGGVARSIGFALANRKIPASLSFIGRDSGKVSVLAESVTAKTGLSVSSAVFGTPQAGQAIRNATLLVNCTSAGMHPNTDSTPVDAALLHSKVTVFDTIYNPAETRLLSDARKAGCRCHNGLSMLLFQALASSKHWTGIDVPVNLFDMDDLQSRI
jgi:shikimate dehydrogenase